MSRDRFISTTAGVSKDVQESDADVWPQCSVGMDEGLSETPEGVACELINLAASQVDGLEGIAYAGTLNNVPSGEYEVERLVVELRYIRSIDGKVAYLVRNAALPLEIEHAVEVGIFY